MQLHENIPPCRHHHGWQRALGARARSAADQRPRGGLDRRARGDGGVRRVGRGVSHRLRLFHRELAPARGGSRGALWAAGAVRRAGDAHADGEERAAADHRPAGGAARQQPGRRARARSKTTAANTGITLIMALELQRPRGDRRCRAQHRQRGRRGRAGPGRAIDQETISQHLYTRDYPDPDLLIRTSGEMRLSNFLLWQLSYTEIYVRRKSFGRTSARRTCAPPSPTTVNGSAASAASRKLLNG